MDCARAAAACRAARRRMASVTRSRRSFAPVMLGQERQAVGVVLLLQPLGGGVRFLFQVFTAGDRRGASPLGEIGVVALRAGVHRSRVDGADETFGQFALGGRTSGLDDDLARDVAPVK